MYLTTTDLDTAADPRDRLRLRYRELAEVLDDVTAERELSVFLAHRRGLSDAEIIEITGEEHTAVRRIVDSHLRDEEADNYEEGPRWIALWPNGWRTTY
ncbi:MAG: hypothetical protein WCA46_22255 [Actinocatenispora sp.]